MKYTHTIFFILFSFSSIIAQTTEAKIAYNNAVKAFNAKDYPGAVGLLETHAESETDFIQAQRLMAELYKKLGDNGKTRKYYKRVLEDSHNQPELWYAYGLSFVRDGMEKEAKEAFNTVLELNPNHDKAKRQIGYLNEEESPEGEIVEVDNSSTAEKTPSKEGGISNDIAKKYANKGIGYYNEKQFKEAALAFDKALEGAEPSAKLYSYAARSNMHLGKADVAIKYLEKAIAEESDNGEYHYYMSKAYEIKGVDNLTKKYAEMATTRGFSGTDEAFNNESTRHYNAGVDFYNEKRYADAVKEYKRAIALNPNKAKYHYMMAVSLKEMDRYKETKNALKDAMNADATYPHAYKLMGDLLFDEGQYRKAASYYEELLNLGEKSYNNYLNVAYCFDRLAVYKKALEYFEMAEQVNPNHEEIKFAVAMGYFKIGKITEAKDRFAKIVEDDPTSVRALKNVSTMCARTGDFKKGLEYSMQWIEVDPNDGEAYNQAGDMLFNLGRGDEADKYKRKAKSLGVVSDPIWY